MTFGRDNRAGNDGAPTNTAQRGLPLAEIERQERQKSIRLYLGMGAIAWTSFIVTDILAAHIHQTSLGYLVALRLAGTGIGLLVYLVIGLRRFGQKALNAIEGITLLLAGLLVSLQAMRCGGATSPLALGVATCTLVRAVLPAPFARVIPTTLGCALTFPATILVASHWLPEIAAELASATVVWSLLQISTFLVLGAVVAAGASHLLWSANEQLHQARKLGNYRLVARIGSGGMGDVWLARQMPLNRPVALKILKESTLSDPSALRRFWREAEVVSSLAHPHTIRVFDFGASDDGVLYIAMELLDGMDLEAIVDRLGPLPPARVVHLGRQACGSLAEAHASGVIHCDLKPANVFVTKVDDEYDFAKVLDFGLARVLTGGHTTVERIRGTPAFMPPEVIKGEPVGPASDVYSMGAVLYWMVTGTPVFEGKGFHDNAMAHLRGVPDRPSKRLGREVPADLEQIILRCLSKRPEDRYADARELEEALTTCACGPAWTDAAARASWEELRPSLRKLAVKRA